MRDVFKCKLLTRKFKNVGIMLFTRHVSKNAMSNLQCPSLTNVFPYLDHKIYAMDLSAGNLIHIISNKANEMTFSTTIFLTMKTSHKTSYFQLFISRFNETEKSLLFKGLNFAIPPKHWNMLIIYFHRNYFIVIYTT